MSEKTPMEKRALDCAETVVDFAWQGHRRMLTSQIPGLAQILVKFAENEIRIAASQDREARER